MSEVRFICYNFLDFLRVRSHISLFFPLVGESIERSNHLQYTSFLFLLVQREWENGKVFHRARRFFSFIPNPCCWKSGSFVRFQSSKLPKVLRFLLHTPYTELQHTVGCKKNSNLKPIISNLLQGTELCGSMSVLRTRRKIVNISRTMSRKEKRRSSKAHVISWNSVFLSSF